MALRATQPDVYDRGLARWEADPADPRAIEPVDPDLDADVSALAIAKELNVPAPAVAAVPLRWVGAALVRMEAERLIGEQRSKSPGGKRTRRGTRSGPIGAPERDGDGAEA